jgi:hypothetical protein
VSALQAFPVAFAGFLLTFASLAHAFDPATKPVVATSATVCAATFAAATLCLSWWAP